MSKVRITYWDDCGNECVRTIDCEDGYNPETVLRSEISDVEEVTHTVDVG